MALNSRQEFVAITIRADGQLEVRVDKIITDTTDGSEIRQPTRRVYTPNMPINTLPARVQKVANIFWDAQTIADYNATHPGG